MPIYDLPIFHCYGPLVIVPVQPAWLYKVQLDYIIKENRKYSSIGWLHRLSESPMFVLQCLRGLDIR